MTDTHPAGSTDGAACDDEGAAAARSVAEWLCLAATPTFAVMALLTGALGGGRWICSARPSMDIRWTEWSRCTCSWVRSIRRLGWSWFLAEDALPPGMIGRLLAVPDEGSSVRTAPINVRTESNSWIRREPCSG